MNKHKTLGIFDYDRHKLCDLYDSQNDLIGQAYDIEITVTKDGMHTLTFNIPYMLETQNSIDVNRNFRWDFLKSDYLIRYQCGSEIIWFVANKPEKSKSSKNIYGRVTCSGFESLLKTRNIYMIFDDENGIGNIQYLMEQILAATGWTFDAGLSDTLYENDGTTIKVRSLKDDGKKGSLGLITTVCNLFQCRPVFDTDQMIVYVKDLKNRQQVLEGEVGKNLQSMTVSYDSSNICTRLYVEGEYGDFGYVGIDDVEVDGEPYGLSFILNFDYYKEIGVFTDDHQAAVDTYIDDIKDVKARIRANAALMIAVEDSLNTLIGQCRMALYYSDDLQTPAYTYGGISVDEAVLVPGDDVVLLKHDSNGYMHEYAEWIGPSQVTGDVYGVAKFAIPSSGQVGAMEVQIEAKEKNIEKLQKKIAVTINPDRIAEYEAEILRMNNEIVVIYEGDTETVGLYEKMASIMKPDGLMYEYQEYIDINQSLLEEQDEIEADFIDAMGYLLRDGSWSDNNYITGQEEHLYADAVDMSNQMSKPSVQYTFNYVRVTEDFGIPPDDIEINAIFRLYDKELGIYDNTFITKITIGVDNKSKGSIEVTNQDITLTGSDLGSLLSRMSQLADLIQQKNELYERAKAITSGGTLIADRLNGQIDVIKNKILSSVSNWYTDERGNMVFVSADGTSAMMLSGAGFMLANGKTDSGDWDWRLTGDGTGLNADEITTGFLSAERIEAGSIQANKLAADVGSSLDLSSNVALNTYIGSEIDSKASQFKLTDSEFSVIFNRTEGPGIASAIEEVADNLAEYEQAMSDYMRYGNGTLELGQTGNNFKTQITNQKLSFLQGNTEVAYVSNQSMYITKARVTDTLSIGTNNGNGYFDWTVTPTGLGLKWRGT